MNAGGMEEGVLDTLKFERASMCVRALYGYYCYFVTIQEKI